MSRADRLLIALGTIALGTVASAERADAQTASRCEWLSSQSAEQLEQFVRDNPSDPCAEAAALMLVERTSPASNSRSAAVGSRY